MSRPVSTSRTANAVIRRIDALHVQALIIQQRCVQPVDRLAVRETVGVLDEARAWLRAARPVEPVLVTHVAKMVNGACARLYNLNQSVR